MKAHDLARQLLAGPNVEVLTSFDQASENATALGAPNVEQRLGEEGPEEVVVLYHSNDGNVWPQA